VDYSKAHERSGRGRGWARFAENEIAGDGTGNRRTGVITGAGEVFQMTGL